MFSLKPAAAAAGADAPSPLLQHLAGEHAEAIARLWPAPHRAFLEASADRRHLVCLAASVRDAPLDPALARRALLGPLKREVAALIDDAPEGLARALGRLGEIAWRAEAYRHLVRLLGLPRTADALRHAERIWDHQIRGLALLSEPLHAAGLGTMGLTADETRLLVELFEALVRRDGPDAAMAVARRWASATSGPDAMSRAIASVRRPLSPPPFEGAGALQPVRTLADLDELAGQMHNCAGTLGWSGDADVAWLVWTGEPRALMRLRDDRLYGWTLDEARGDSNRAPPPEARAEITMALRIMGVHVGYDAETLMRALREARDREPATTREQAIDWTFGD